MSSSQIPKFKNPPVVETVLGIEFAPLQRWGIPHFGLFWQEIREEFPTYAIKPPLESHIEASDLVLRRTREIQIEAIDQPEFRCWYLNPTAHGNLIQVQNDRFVYNWRKLSSDTSYPSYEEFCRPTFEKHWRSFNRFVTAEQLGPIDAVQCEVSYINHIAKGDGWSGVEDWHEIFNVLAPTAKHEFLPHPESARFGLHFLMPKEKGRLRVSASHAIRNEDGIEIIVFNLTARGKPASSEYADIREWFDMAREWVVKGFTDMTTDSMHQLWGREQ